jgi:VWFA-related protein
MGALALAQQLASESAAPSSSLRITARAVLVDVIVTDSSGKPVIALPQSAFSITEDGKPQSISFFEEHAAEPVRAAMPNLPPNTFSNFSPFPEPPVVNVVLLDTLNTAMTLQMNMHAQVKRFLSQTPPGRRTALFTMGINLRLIQGFTDDPNVFSKALENKKNIEIEQATMLKAQIEDGSQKALIGMMNQRVDSHGSTAASPEMSASLQNFFAESDSARSNNRMLMTLANLRRLAAFLQGVPGRKNIIWFAQKVPGAFNVEGGAMQSSNPIVDDQIKETLGILSSERAAIYPISPRGVPGAGDIIETVDSSGGGPKDWISDMLNAQTLAEQSGGRATANTNGIAGAIEKISSDGNHFYTVSYKPVNGKMDGGWRKIGVKVDGGKYQLSYRRGYFAVDTGLAGNGSKKTAKAKARMQLEAQERADPLLSQMILGMPQTQQIVYRVAVTPTIAPARDAHGREDETHYSADFTIDEKDVALKQDASGKRKGSLDVLMILYDRYGTIVSREAHLAQLNLTPDAYALAQKAGVQLHGDFGVPKGDYWLRIGIYDKNSQKVGTIEIPLNEVTPLKIATE